MKKLTLFKLSCLMVFAMSLFQGCQNHDAFGEDLEVQIVPTDLSYIDILGVREFSYIETQAPTYNSNGHPIVFEIVSIKKDDVILDNSYLDATKIVNYTILESDIAIVDSGEDRTVYTTDLSQSGKIIIEDENPFANGEYFFTIKGTVGTNGPIESVIFEDALRLVVGPELVGGISYCPFKLNFVAGGSEVSVPADVFGGNSDIRFELGSDSDKLSIDSNTGAISLNSSYNISATETLNPIINVVSNISEEVVSFEGFFTAVLSTASVVLDKETDYFFYPTLKPNNKDIPRAGGNGYTVETSDFADKPGWVQKHFYKEIVNNRKIGFTEVLDTRADAGVSGITGTQFNYWGPLANPFESWFILNPVNLTQYAGCFDTKVVFWIRQNITQASLDNLFPGHTETPVGIEIKITDDYTEDVSTTSWTDINELLTCKIGEAGDDFVGTPYPISGEIGAEGSANNLWVRCELDLADYSDIPAFTIAFRTKTNYDSDLSGNLRGELTISDLHFLAAEK